MTYEELAKAILALPEEQRKRKAVVSGFSSTHQIRMEISSFEEYEGIEDDSDFPYLSSDNMRLL